MGKENSHVEVRGQVAAVVFDLLPPCGSQTSNSGCQSALAANYKFKDRLFNVVRAGPARAA